MNNQESTYDQLWQHYSQDSQKFHLMAFLPNAKSCVAAQKAIADGQAIETILQILRFAPEFQRTKDREGEDSALFYARLAVEYACRSHAERRRNPPNPVLNLLSNILKINGSDTQNSFRERHTSRQGSSRSKPEIVDLGMLDTEYAELVKNEEVHPVQPRIDLGDLIASILLKLCLISAWILLLFVCLSFWIRFTGGAAICNKPLPYLVDICQLSKARNGSL